MVATWKEFVHAFRRLGQRGDRLANGVLVLVLALGIAAGTSVFVVVDAMLIRSMPFPAADRLVSVKLSMFGYRRSPSVANVAVYEAWRRDVGDAIELAGQMGVGAAVSGLGRTLAIQAVGVTPNMIALLGVEPLYGRGFVSADNERGAPRTVLISYGFWRGLLGSDPNAVGRTLTLNDQDYRIVGVMPRVFRVPLVPVSDQSEVWVPIRCAQELWGTPDDPSFPLEILGRIRVGASIAGIEAKLNAITRDLQGGTGGPRTPDANRNVAEVNAIQDVRSKFVRTPLLLASGMVVLVVLLSFFNAVILIMARAIAREREMATRIALGASRWRLVLQYISETIAISLLGWLLGAGIAYPVSATIVALGATILPDISSITFNPRTVLFSFSLAIIAGVASGAWPAVTAFHRSPVDALTSRVSVSRRTNRRMHSLLALEIAFSAIVLSVIGLLAFSFLRLTDIDRGYEVKNVAVAGFLLPDRIYPTEQVRRAFRFRLLDELRRNPDFVFPAVSNAAPLVFDAGGMAWNSGDQVNKAGRRVAIWAVAGDYFLSLRMPILRGREQDIVANPEAVAVDATAARVLFNREDPLGRRLLWKVGREQREGIVVAVIGDIQNLYHNDEGYRRGRAAPHIYVAGAALDSHVVCVVTQVRGNMARALDNLQETIARVDSRLPVEPITLERKVSATLAEERFLVVLIGIFAILAVTLTAAGVFAVAAHSTVQRTHEIGVRLALGAGPNRIVLMILRESLYLVMAGGAAGVLSALALGRTLRGLVFEISPSDPAMIAGATLLCGAVWILASMVPAIRAANVKDAGLLLHQD